MACGRNDVAVWRGEAHTSAGSWRSIRRRLSDLFLEVQVGVAAEAALVVV